MAGGQAAVPPVDPVFEQARKEWREAVDQISDEKEPMVNSVHWQGVDQLGNGLRVEGTAPDGLVEAFSVYDSHSFALAVQWHPEWKVMENLFYKSIFKKFGDACLKHKLENN